MLRMALDINHTFQITTRIIPTSSSGIAERCAYEQPSISEWSRSRGRFKLTIAEKATTLESNGFRFWIRVGPCLIGLVFFFITPTATEGHRVSFFILFKRHINPSMVDHSVKIHPDQHHVACVLEEKVDAEKFDFLRKTRTLSDGFCGF